MINRRFAFVYPGQGSQYVGMAADLWQTSPKYQHFLHESEVTIDRQLTKIMFDGPAEVLKETANAQPALYMHEVALTRALEDLGIRPVIVAGHSVGEYAALTAANVLDHGHALWLVNQRGVLMGQAGKLSPGGMMAVIGLDDAQIVRCCLEAGENVVVANYNSPGQTIISGDNAGLEKAAELCKAAGAKRCLPLAVSGAFHSPLVREANALLAENINKVTFEDAIIPVVTNYDGLAHSDGGEIRANVLSQMESSVQWTKTMQTISDFGVDAIIEVGPGSVLAGLAKRTVPNIPVHQVSTLEQLHSLGILLNQ